MARLPRRLPEPLRRIAQVARERGWEITRRRSGHYAWRSPEGQVITTAATPSDCRTTRNDTAKLRRAGLDDRPRKHRRT